MVIYKTKNSEYEEREINRVRAMFKITNHRESTYYQILGSFNPNEINIISNHNTLYLNERELSLTQLINILIPDVLLGNRIVGKLIQAKREKFTLKDLIITTPVESIR